MHITDSLVGFQYRSVRERESIYDIINNVLISEAGLGSVSVKVD